MHIASRFEGDNDARTMGLQHDCYHEAVGIIAGTCQNAYLIAADLLEHKTELASKLRDVEAFDHRLLQDAHDYLAADWRHRNGLTETRLPEVADETKITSDWRAWISSEAQSWPEFRPDLVRAICKVLVADQHGLHDELIALAVLRRALRRSYRSVARLIVPGNQNQLQWAALRERLDEDAAWSITEELSCYDLPSASQVINLLHYARSEDLCRGQRDELTEICGILSIWEWNDGALAALVWLYERVGSFPDGLAVGEDGIDGVASRLANHVLLEFWPDD